MFKGIEMVEVFDRTQKTREQNINIWQTTEQKHKEPKSKLVDATINRTFCFILLQL